MRILVREFVTEGGYERQAPPPSLVREGAAMRAALIADLIAIGHHEIVSTVAGADAVWLIAPETGGCLERLARRAEQDGRLLLGSGAAAVRRAADKAGLAQILAHHGVSYPATRVVRTAAEGRDAAHELGYPVVVKPRRGAGSVGVSLARNDAELCHGLSRVRAVGRDAALVQRYIRGVAASVSLLANGTRAVPLTVNGQTFDPRRRFSYRGGITPIDHPLARQAAEQGRRACEAIGGLRGYVGVDLVLTDKEAVVIEINPRLTTAYLGVRAAIDSNIAALALAACDGHLPDMVSAKRQVRFKA